MRTWLANGLVLGIAGGCVALAGLVGEHLSFGWIPQRIALWALATAALAFGLHGLSRAEPIAHLSRFFALASGTIGFVAIVHAWVAPRVGTEAWLRMASTYHAPLTVGISAFPGLFCAALDGLIWSRRISGLLVRLYFGAAAVPLAIAIYDPWLGIGTLESLRILEMRPGQTHYSGMGALFGVGDVHVATSWVAAAVLVIGFGDVRRTWVDSEAKRVRRLGALALGLAAAGLVVGALLTRRSILNGDDRLWVGSAYAAGTTAMALTGFLLGTRCHACGRSIGWTALRGGSIARIPARLAGLRECPSCGSSLLSNPVVQKVPATGNDFHGPSFASREKGKE